MADTQNRTLLILRHAKSAWDTDAASDFERPLSKRGRKDAPRMGAWMAATDLVPDRILCSPARRARQTAKRIAAALDLDPDTIVFDERIYHASLGGLLRVLAESAGSASRLLLVGHNPGLEDLVRCVAADAVTTPADGKLLPTCTLAGLEMPAAWERTPSGAGRLVTLKRPRDLDAG